ncbi:hypothetical protein LINPERPRIM_LOCUS2945 [Linum perenne]
MLVLSVAVWAEQLWILRETSSPRQVDQFASTYALS